MTTRYMILTGLFAALIALGSQFSILIGPVPHTLQVFFVMLTGLILGGRWGFTSVLVWVLLGAFGLPVFAQGKAGAAHVLGPTGGFMAGLMLCAWLVGSLTERYNPGQAKTVGVLVLGLAVLYAVGLAGFMASFAFFLHKPMTLEKALTLAAAPFLPFDAIKALLAGYLGVRIRRALIRAGLIVPRTKPTLS